MRRKLIVSFILITVFIGIGAGVAFVLIKTAPEPPQVDLARSPLLVEAIRVEPKTVTESIVGFGTARADRYAQLSAQVAGEIIGVADDLEIGTEVEQGQVLIRIDEHDYKQHLARVESLLASDEAQLQQLDTEAENLDRLIGPAEKEFASAQFEFDKVDDLYNKGAAPKREHEQTRHVLEQTRRMLLALQNQRSLLPSKRAQVSASRDNHRAELALTRLELERCSVRAPYAGKVAEKYIEIGERVQRGSPLLSLLDPQWIEVPVALPVSVRPRVTIGSACTLTLPSQPNINWQGRVRRIAPAANEATRTFELFVEVNNAEQTNELLPGFFVEADIEGPTLTDVLVVPRRSVQQSQVFIYNDGKASKRNVKVDRILRDRSVIKGIRSGDMVIISNLDALYEGAPVRLADNLLPNSQQIAPTPGSQPSVAERNVGPLTSQK